MLPLDQAPTPAEYALLQSAIKANWKREKARQVQRGPALGSDFDHIYATRIQLGALGEAMVVYFANSPECGATGNCPMAVYVREAKNYRRVIDAGGWGTALLPSGGPVPDVAFYWNMSAAESDADVFHFVNGKFVGQGGPSCTDKNSSSAVCAAMTAALDSGPGPVRAISPAEYEALRPLLAASLKTQAFVLDQTHGLNILHISGTAITAVEFGSCRANRNCTISIYAHNDRENNYWPLLLNASGWGISTGWGDPLSGAYVLIAHNLSPTQAELTEYRLLSLQKPGDWGPGSRLLPKACEIITSKTRHWPAEWTPAAFAVQPVSCFQTPSAQKIQFPAADPTNVFEAVQDSTGRVWAITSGFSPELYRWHKGAWKLVTIDDVTGTNPRGLWPGPNGGALALYGSSAPGSPEKLLVWLRGERTKILARIPATPQPGVLDSFEVQTAVPAPLGTVLIAGNGDDFYRDGVLIHQAHQVLFRLAAKGQLQQIYSIAPNQYRPHYPSTGQESITPMPLHTARSPDGKIWIWSRFSSGITAGEKVFDGFLITDGKTVEARQIPGLPTNHLQDLASWDNHHLVAAELNEGLYTINTATLKTRPVLEPQPGAFRFVEKIFSVGHDHYALTSKAGAPALLDEFFHGSLWRFHNGRWKELLDDIKGASRTGLVAPDGFWLATMNRGLWFFPANGQPRKIDWRNGLSLASANRIFHLPDGEILATDTAHMRSVAFAPQALLSQPKPSSTFSVLHPFLGLQPDSREHIWGLLPPGLLGEWDGKQWLQHPLPSLIRASRLTRLDVDTRGRVWLFPNCRLGPMAIFDPLASVWTTYANYRFALTRQTQPVAFLHPDDDPMRPIYGHDSQIVFVGPCWGVNYFDGSRWRLWRNNQLPGAGQRDLTIPPFFDHAGDLAIDVRSNTWQWASATGWVETTYEPQQRHPDPFFQIMLNDSPVQDSQGRSWLVADDSLYERHGQNERLIFSGSALQPFIDGRQIVRVLLDARDDVFLETQNPFSYVVLPPSTYSVNSQPTR